MLSNELDAMAAGLVSRTDSRTQVHLESGASNRSLEPLPHVTCR
jgi:hypothetical protein